MNRSEFSAPDAIRALLGKERYGFSDLCLTVQILRSPEGCPWDREQTHQSLRRCLIEETYEVAEAIDREDSPLLREELGDLLLQAVFHGAMEEEAGRFAIGDAIDGVVRKMIRRHPHIFKDESVSSSREVGELWERVKREEKGQKDPRDVLDAIPRPLPALMRSQKITHKAGKLGYREEARLLPSLLGDAEGEEKAALLATLLREIAAEADREGLLAEELLEAENVRQLARAAAFFEKK